MFKALIFLVMATGMCRGVEVEFEIIKEANGTLLYGHYLDQERVFKIYDHKNNKLRMSYTNVDRKDLNIIGKKKVTILNPVPEGDVQVSPVVWSAFGIKKRMLEDRYISKWELSDGLMQYYLKKMAGGPPKDADPSGIGVIVFESDKKNFIHVVTYWRNENDDMVKIDEFDHGLDGGMIFSGKLEGDRMRYVNGVDKLVTERKVEIKR